MRAKSGHHPNESWKSSDFYVSLTLFDVRDVAVFHPPAAPTAFGEVTRAGWLIWTMTMTSRRYKKIKSYQGGK